GEPVDLPGARLGLPPIRRSGDPSSPPPHGTSPRAIPTGGGRGSRANRRVGHVVRVSIRPAASARASWICCRGKKRTRKTRRRTKSHRTPENGSDLSFVLARGLIAGCARFGRASFGGRGSGASGNCGPAEGPRA